MLRALDIIAFNLTKAGGWGEATLTPTFFEDAYLSNA